MKITNAVTLLATLVAMLVAGIAYGQPATTQSESTAQKNTDTSSTRRGVELMTVRASGNIGHMSISVVKGPAMNSAPSWNTFATTLVGDAKDRKLNLTQVPVTDPTMYTVCTSGKVDWYNFVYSSSVGMWDGMFPVDPPFNAERGHIVLQLIQAESASGGNDISFAMIQVTSSSSDEWNTLGDTLMFNQGLDYSLTAIGIKADGQLVTSGPSTQLVARVIFITKMKLFTGGNSQPGLDAVRNFVEQQNNFTVTYTVQFVGVPESKVSASVSLSGFSNSRPRLTIMPSSITLTNGEIGRLYSIFASPAVSGATWQPIGTVNNGGSIAITHDENMRYFRAVSQ